MNVQNLTIKLIEHGIVAHLVFAANIKQSYGPLLRKEFHFQSICLELKDRFFIKICIHINNDKIQAGIIKHLFCKFQTELSTLIDVRISFCSIFHCTKSA